MFYHTHRRAFGLLLGALTGLIYALVSENINTLIMPGIPFFRPPFGPVGNAVLGFLVGALLGFITAWAETGAKGVILGSLTGSLILALATLLTASGGQSDILLGLAIVFIPAAAVLAPVLILFRWLVNREEMAYRETMTWKPPSRLSRLGPPVLVLLLAGAAGLTSMYNDLGRAVVPRMDALIREGQQSTNTEALPAPLQDERITAFDEHAHQPYTLQWVKDDENRFSIPRPNVSQFDQSTVIARFADGYLLACVYPTPTMEPRCKDFPPK